jgi:molybdopterin synthase catalytic subunit
MVEITRKPISPEAVINQAKSESSGCVVTYVGLIRNESQGKPVLSVEYQDRDGNAQRRLQEIADQIKSKWPVNTVSITHRIGKLLVGDINLVIAIAAAHRKEGLAACQYAVDQFKQSLPTWKKETYQDGSTSTRD